jgi:hypothetical protein
MIVGGGRRRFEEGEVRMWMGKGIERLGRGITGVLALGGMRVREERWMAVGESEAESALGGMVDAFCLKS